MKNIFTLMLCLVINLAIAQPPAGSRIEIQRSLSDTNKVVVDENGKQLRYKEYMPLVKSGQYKLRFNGDPSLPETKGQLVRMTAEDKLRVENIRMYGQTPQNNEVLKVDTPLDVLPLSRALLKDVFSRKALLMMFWSPDIPSSISSIIRMSAQLRGYNQDSLVVLLITTAEKARADVLSKVASTMNARIVSDAEDIFNTYQVSAMPLYIIADQNRIIRHNLTGTAPTFALWTKQTLDEVLGVVPEGTYTLHRDPKFSELSTNAFLFFQAKNYPEAAKAYDILFEYSKGKSTSSETFNAACTWARLGDKDKAFAYLTQAVFAQKWRSMSGLTSNENLESLRSDKRWQGILDQVVINQRSMMPIPNTTN